MLDPRLKNVLRLCYIITPDCPEKSSPLEEAERAIVAGATLIQYGTGPVGPDHFREASSIRTLCRCNAVPFIVPDDILFAKAVKADGVHFSPPLNQVRRAREILGPHALIGATITHPSPLCPEDLALCDYLRSDVPTLSHKTERHNLPVVLLLSSRDLEKPEGDYGCCGIAVKGLETISAAGLYPAVCRKPASPILKHPWNDEFRVIEKILNHAPDKQKVELAERVPPGDDAALLASLANPVVTTDTQREGVHFRLEWQTPEEVGRKAVSAALSDLAASYAKPVSLFINLSLPEHASEDLAESLYKGIQQSLERYGCSLGGGNLSSGEELSLDLFAIGEGSAALCPLRSNARPGDGLYVTGSLGVAAAGLDLLFKKDFSSPHLVDKFKNPTARFDAAAVLEKHGVACVMDISDGLMGDALHIAEASGVTIDFEIAREHIPEELTRYGRRYGRDPREVMLSGGEDYELLFTCKEETFRKIKKRVPEAFQVGRCLPFGGKPILNPLRDVTSFRHGAYNRQ